MPVQPDWRRRRPARPVKRNAVADALLEAGRHALLHYRYRSAFA
ncbi:MAG: hypothetical protein NTX54_12120 [Chloroflexi bacterium]|nr:hypothetical protein [Chloroflexota bacterium]